MIRHRDVVNAVRDAIFVADMETGMIVDANRAAEALCGRSLAELQLLHYPELHPPKVAEAARRGFEKQAPVPGLTEASVLHKDGHRIPVEITSSHFTAANGRRMLVGVFRSTTERKQAEQALLRQNEFIQAALDNISDGVVACDDAGNLALFNRTARKWHGIDALKLPPDQWSSHYDLFGPDGTSPLATESIPLKRAFNGEHLHDVGMTIAANGQPLRHLLASGRPFYDDQDHKLGAVVAMHDITERKQAEAALRESEERFRRVFEEGPLGIALAGNDYRFLKVNSALCRMVGYDEAELTQMTFLDITHPDDVEANRELSGRLFRWEIPKYRLQKRYVKKDGETIWINLTASVIRDAEGLPLYGLAMIEDITETKRAQEEAIARQKLEGLGVLAGGIAHDFNNLLGSILATSELVLSELPGGSPAYDGVESIKNVADRAAEIVRQMLAYAGQESTVFGPLDLSGLVNEMLQLLKVSICKRAQLTVDLPPNLPAVRANAAAIRQVVMNLITNASEALGEKEGVISVTLTHVRSGPDQFADSTPSLPQNDHLRLAVSDTGTGITEGIQARIFDPFFTTKFTGRGLGLSAVQGIVHNHGGTINVVSAPGQGSRFEVLLPCTSQPAQDTPDIPVPASPGAVGSGDATVLVIEDEEVLRVAVSKMLRKRGFSVVEASDGPAGLDLFRGNVQKIDAVLLDLTLPGKSGREVLEELRRMRPDVKVIITTAYGHDSVRKAIGEQQPWLYIRKPYRLSEVADLIRSGCLHTGSGGHAAG